MIKTSLLALAIVATAVLPATAQRTESKLKPTDTISLRISGVPQEDAVGISQNYLIADDGKFPLPYVGRIRASGLTPSELGMRVEQAYKSADIFTRPTVVVVTAETEADTLADAQKMVTINGEVRAPQRAGYNKDMTLLDAIAAAGGFTDWADKKRVRLMRGNRTTEHNVTEISRNPQLNVKLQPNDKIIVIHR